MHPAAPRTRLAADSYHRGTLQYEKTLKLLNRISLIRWIIIMTGLSPLVIIWESLDHPATHLSGNTTQLLLLISAAFLTTGAALWITLNRITKKRQYRNFTYRLALHFMKELGHTNPAQTLAQNPQYLSAFEEVIKAVKTELTAAGKPHALAGNQLTTIGLRLYETISPAHWIGSLVLTNEHSLQQAPRLITLIKEQHLTDYDQLATMMDTMS